MEYCVLILLFRPKASYKLWHIKLFETMGVGAQNHLGAPIFCRWVTCIFLLKKNVYIKKPELRKLTVFIRV